MPIRIVFFRFRHYTPDERTPRASYGYRKANSMTMTTFEAGETEGRGYLALPESGEGPGVLMLHAWWGLSPFFTELCDRVAKAGFVAFAPDMYGGRVVDTVEDAEQQVQAMDKTKTAAIVQGALAHLRGLPATGGRPVGVLGISMGAAWALTATNMAPDDIGAVAVLYGTAGEVDFSATRAAFQGHFAEEDPFEPTEAVQELEGYLRAAGREAAFFTYPGVTHWFFEADRPEYNAEAAEQVWDRTVAFLRERLAP